LALPWGILAFDFAVNLVIFSVFRISHGYAGALSAIYVMFFVLGLLSIVWSLPFGLALGVSRRSYFAGTVLLAVSLAAVYGLPLALLQVIEQTTAGWGMNLHFFRVPYILAGPWYLTWLTSFVGLALMFVYGMWFGLIYRRGNLLGLLAFSGAQVIVVLAGVVIISHVHAWPAIGQFFATVGAAGLTGLLAALAAVLLVGGYATMHRVTV
jgi:hypothetical protein